jgi:hypothetical protein
LGGSSYKQIWTSAVWRIATPIGAGAIHPIRSGPFFRILSEDTERNLNNSKVWHTDFQPQISMSGASK